MVNSCNSRSPILLDTPERPNGASGNTSVIEIPDSGERSHPRRRRHESMEDVIIADSPKRARVDVPVIDLTTDNEEESSSSDNHSGLLITLDSPYYAEIMRRGQYLSDHNRYMRLRRSASLRRSSSHHPRRQHEDRHSNLDSLASSNTDPAGRNNNFLNGVRPENAEQTILVDDDDSATSQSTSHERTSGFSRPSCSRVWPPNSIIRVSTTDNTRPTSSLVRSERSRLLYGSQPQESTDSDSERRGNRRDTSQQLRAIRRNQRRIREHSRHLRERLEHISSTFTHFANNSLHENAGRTLQPPASQESGVHSSMYIRPNNPTVETNPIRSNNRASSPLQPEARQFDIHDIMSPLQPPLQDIMLPALLSFWGPDSRLRHFGDPDDDGEDYEALLSLTERLGQVKPKGLSKAEMEEIPAFRYSAASKDSSNGSCVVCMMNYSNKEKLRRLPCNHDFHAKCIDRWLKNNRSCPVCRKDVASK